MGIKLSEHFNFSKLLKFTFPTIIMMIFTSLYGVVDGIFISNFAGSEPFAAINIVWPIIMLFSTVGFMVGTGGSALVSKTLGEEKKRKS
jgi:Na+-driven multidrug efflux pump